MNVYKGKRSSLVGLPNVTKWAGNNIPVKQYQDVGRFKHKNDGMANWYNEMLGKNYLNKHSGHESIGKTAFLQN